jgi:hypothetical protein
MNLIPIQITLQAANAQDYRKLVQDIAGTMQESAAPALQQPVVPILHIASAPRANPADAMQAYAGSAPAAPTAVQAAPMVPASAPPVQAVHVTQTAPAAVPVSSAPSYTMEQLGVAAGPLVDAGRSAELVGWLQQNHGVNALTQLDPAHYGAFAAYLRSLGAKI